MATIDQTAIRNATLLGLAFIVPAALIGSLIVDDAPGWAAWAFLVLAAAGFTAAGAKGGAARPDTPMLHGAVAALLTSIIAQVVGGIWAAADDRTFSVVAAVLTVLLAVCLGVAGALGYDWFRRRRLALHL